MADCSRPPHPQSRNLSGVFGFKNKSAYDDVFVSRPIMRAPAFAPGVKDYAEIFNCSKPSSIPVLDLDDAFERREEEIDYGNVFGVSADGVGVRRTHDSHARSRGLARSTAVEDSRKLPHESLFEKKHSISPDKINRGGKGDTDEKNSLDRFSELPVPARAFAETVPLKKASVTVSRSGATTNNSKQYGDEVPEGKHSRMLSSSGLPEHGADVLVEINMRSRNGYGSDKSVSSDRQMDNVIIRPNVQMSEATAVTVTSLHLLGSMATSDDLGRHNAREEGHGGLNCSSQVGEHVHSLDKSFVRDSSEDENLVKPNVSRSNLSPDLTHDHGGALGTPEVATGNSSARNSNDNENGKGDSYSYSQQDVNFQINNSQVNASNIRPQESSKSTPATHSQHSFGNMSTSHESKVNPEITCSRSVDSESRDSSSNGFLANSGKSKNEVEHVDPAMKKASALKADVSKRIKDNNSPCSSDDEIDNNSEAFVSAAAVKKAIKEAQSLINIAKESNGVKGFMSFVMARNSEQVKILEEKVKEKPKFCEPAQAEIQNNLSTNSSRKDYSAPWSAGSEMKKAPADINVEDLNLKGIELGVLEKLNKMGPGLMEMQSRLKEKTLGPAATQHTPPIVNTFQERLAVYSTVDEKLAHRKEEVSLHDIITDSGQVRHVPEACCSVLPNFVKIEKELDSAGHESFLNNNPESYTPTKITETKKESQKVMKSSDQGFMMQSFHNDFVQMKAGCTANSSEVKQDAEAVAVAEHIRSNHNEAIKIETEGHVFSDLTSLEEENVEESELDPLDQVFDCEDTDSQDYASAEENWVSSDMDDEFNDKDQHFSPQDNLNKIGGIENTVVSEVTVLTEDVLPSSIINLHDDKIIEEIDDMPLQNILTKEAQVSGDKTAPIIHSSNENPVVEKTDKSVDMLSPNTAACDAEVTSEEPTEPILTDHPIVEEANGSENATLPNMLINEVKIASEETTVPFLNSSSGDPIFEEADITEDVSVLFIVSPRATITLEDGALSCFNNGNGYTSVETDGTEDVTEPNMVTHEATIISENDLAQCFDYSNEDWIVERSVEDTTTKSRVSLLNNEHEVATEAAKLHEQTTLKIEKRDFVARVETESASDHEPSHNEGSEVELISTDDLAEESGADTIEESVPAPWIFEPPKQEVDGTNFCNLDSRIQDREEFEQPNDAGVEVDAIDDSHKTVNFKGFENDHVSVDVAGMENATETESTPWDSEPVNHELEGEAQFSEPLPDSIKHKETTEFEQLSENLIQPVETHERRKWEIPRDTFELPELEVGASETQDIMKQDSIEIERQMDKRERKKWEIPVENFELPVLGDEVVEDNEERVTGRATQSAEKPERKKWKIQKEVFEVPILCAEAVQDTPEQDGFVIKTPSAEEMGITDNSSNTVSFREEMVQHDEVQNELPVNAEPLPDEAVSSELCGENSEEEITKEWMPDTKLPSEEEPCKQLSATSNQQDAKVGDGKAIGQEECTKQEVNVKDEIKKTFGMLWKKLYSGKPDEGSELVGLMGKENVNFKDKIGGGIEKDLNLKGPVELVESPWQHDYVEALNIAGSRFGNEENREAASFFEPFKVNRSSASKSGEFVSIETREGQINSMRAFDSCKYQENEIGSDTEKTCDENYNANHAESQPEEVLSSSGSEDWSEMAPTHEACDLKKEGTPKCNILPSDANEYRKLDSETPRGLKPFLPDVRFEDYAENTENMKVLQQNEQDDISAENLSGTHRVDDISYKRNTTNDQEDTSFSRQDIKSVSDINVPDVTQSNGFEQKEDKNETYPDKIEQTRCWKWIFGDGLRDKNNEQYEAPEVKQSHEVKATTKETTDEINSSHTRNAKINGDKRTSMENALPTSMHKEVMPDQDVLKSLTRAKEMERIVVERAIREARERAFIEARERAAMERANAEARERAAMEKTNSESRERIASERAKAEARERAALERANADAQKKTSNGQERSQRTSSETKLASEKNSLEANRKAQLERAAVERATTEARQRALEKAISRKEQVSQSSSSRSTNTSTDQFGLSSRDDQPSESALRFKARNERHQRIAERAAKALAEKNMRDLLVQREQAERNRLAEVLDADVKRWARGKTGNLRALLSTLQYILGADSGWQSIHLTEIVTADAVKKAYRKATLFVHPDKLQQRGATIRQKYICEKVFDLLKEAWNKFDRDER